MIPLPWDLAGDLQKLETFLLRHPTLLPPRGFLFDMNYKWNYASAHSFASDFVIQYLDGDLANKLADTPAERKIHSRRARAARSWGPVRYCLNAYNEHKAKRLAEKQEWDLENLIEDVEEDYVRKQAQLRAAIARELFHLYRRIAEADTRAGYTDTRQRQLKVVFLDWTRGYLGAFLPTRPSLNLHVHLRGQGQHAEAKHMWFD